MGWSPDASGAEIKFRRNLFLMAIMTHTLTLSLPVLLTLFQTLPDRPFPELIPYWWPLKPAPDRTRQFLIVRWSNFGVTSLNLWAYR